jgi:hypothetical protein
MSISSSYSPSTTSAEGLLTAKAVMRDDESRLAATLRTTGGDAPSANRKRRAAAVAAQRNCVRTQTKAVVAEIIRAVEARLPGRIRDLDVDVQQDQFVLRGVSSSYYVKQVAGHLAMTAMDARLLGQLSNEIEVRSIR